MVNLPESLYLDYTTGASTPRFAGGEGCFFTEGDRERIKRLIELLNDVSSTRGVAIVQLFHVYDTNKFAKEKGRELGLLLWNSTGTTYSLLQEICAGHRLLSPPRISMKQSASICYALVLIQCMASHPEARMGLIQAEIPQYFYPFLKTKERGLVQFDHLREASLSVIRELLKEEDLIRIIKIVRYLLKTGTVPLCLGCMDVGDEVVKTMAALVVRNILEQSEGKFYFGSHISRFVTVSKALSKMVDEFTPRPPTALVKNILHCYLRLSEIPRYHEALTKCYPAKLRDPGYLNHVCDETTRSLAHQVFSRCQ